ncbi:MAG: hypothetical protein ACI37Z_06915 [Candidatus Gastranaerophilaceae bacterium]
MNKEIGSEFWNVPLCEKDNNLFSKSTLWFLSGRVALNYILLDIQKKHSVKKAFLPSWCCDSMIKPFLHNGIDVEFYSVYYDGNRLVQKIPKYAELILVMDYFGFCGEVDFSNYSGIVIRDLTHTIFCKNYNDADYYFGSIRKWCGIFTGGFAWGKYLNDCDSNISIPNQRYVELRKNSMEKKQKYIDGISEFKDFLETFAQAEEVLDKIEDIESAYDRDIQMMNHINVEFIRSKRRENAQVLLEKIGEFSIFKNIGKCDCPLFVPILVDNRDAIRNKLTENGIYCPVHWPITDYHSVNGETKRLYEKEISLICDQRYTTEDMYRIAEVVKEGLIEC